MSFAKFAGAYNKLKNMVVQKPVVPNLATDNRQLDVLHPETGEWCKMVNGRIIEYDDYATAVCGAGSTDQKQMLDHRNYIMKKDGLSNKPPSTDFKPNVGIVTDLSFQQQSMESIMRLHAAEARATDSTKLN